MGESSRSGNEPDGRHRPPEDWLDELAEPSEHEASEGGAKTAHDSASPNDWMASLRDLDLTWNDATRAGGRQPARPADDWLQSLSDEFQTRVHTQAGNGTAIEDRGASWHMLADEDAAFDEDDDTALPPAETAEWTNTDAGAAPPVTEQSAKPSPAPVRARARARRRSRRWVVAMVAAAAVLLLGGATALVALAGRSGSGRSTPRAATTNVKSHQSTTTTVGSTTTVAPSTTATPATSLPPTPQSFTVQSTCGRRTCALGVRAGPGTTAQLVSNIRTGQVVQIDCSTHGELVKDADSGQQSDVWYRYAGTNNYSSSLYLQGPTVPSC